MFRHGSVSIKTGRPWQNRHIETGAVAFGRVRGVNRTNMPVLLPAPVVTFDGTLDLLTRRDHDLDLAIEDEAERIYVIIDSRHEECSALQLKRQYQRFARNGLGDQRQKRVGNVTVIEVPIGYGLASCCLPSF